MKRVILTILLVLCIVPIIRCAKNDPGNAPVIIPTPEKPDQPTPTPIPQPIHYRGFRKPNGGYGAFPGAPHMLADRPTVLPTKFNWKTLGFDIKVRNQGSCGSCYAHASAEILEWASLIYLEKTGQLSVQQLVSCATDNYGCSGGYLEGDYMVKTGLALETDFPYTGMNSSCKQGLKAFDIGVETINIGDGTNSPTTDQLKAAIMQYGPLAVSVAASASWDTYNGGIKVLCGGVSIDHMVVAYGWDDTQGSNGVWFVRNSWGETFGEQGDLRMPYGCDQIGTDAGVVLVKPIAQYQH